MDRLSGADVRFHKLHEHKLRTSIPALLLTFLASAGIARADDPAALLSLGVPSEASKPRFFVMGEDLDFRRDGGNDPLGWKVSLEPEDEPPSETPDDDEKRELHPIAPSERFAIGLREHLLHGAGPNRPRSFAAIGLEALVPRRLELTPILFVSGDGDVSARLTGRYELPLTQRATLEPRVELNANTRDAREFGIESGFRDIELGLRLRYEIRSELVPYVGLKWSRKLGGTAKLAEQFGKDVSAFGLVVGIRLWF